MLPKVPKFPPPPCPFATCPQVTTALMTLVGAPCTFQTQADAKPTVSRLVLALAQFRSVYTGTVTFQHFPVGLSPVVSGTEWVVNRVVKGPKSVVTFPPI